jgi:hypothetical protein
MGKLCAPLLLCASLILGACSTSPSKSVQAYQPPKKWSLGYSSAASAAMAATFDNARLKPGDFVWRREIPPAGPTTVVVSLENQMAYVYKSGQLIGAATISSGKAGHGTPVGIFPVLQKARTHKSNRYANAPMPFMQRLNWHGVALHGGSIPGYPASHGCVRLPMKFAERLFGLTALGSQVIIED